MTEEEQKRLAQLENTAYEAFLKYEETQRELPDSSKENTEVWDKALNNIRQTKKAWEKAEADVEEYSDKIDEALSFPKLIHYGNYNVNPEDGPFTDSPEALLKRKSLHSKQEEEIQHPVKLFFEMKHE